MILTFLSNLILLLALASYIFAIFFYICICIYIFKEIIKFCKCKDSKDSDRFHGRTAEKKILRRFLEQKEGGSILIAGKRGIGKTRLVREILDERQRKKGDMLHLDIPLIIINKSDGINRSDESEEYRSIILKAIASALINHKFSRWDLMLAFINRISEVLELGKRRKGIKDLKQFVDYCDVNHLNSHKINLGATNKALLDVGINKMISSQLDISDARLEMKLISIFKSMREHKFVIVLDELDKLNIKSDKPNISDILVYLKNLFSASNVYCIAIASYEQGISIYNIINKRKDNYKLTLFKNVIMLGSLEPEKFKELVKSEIEEVNENKPIDSEQMLRITTGLGIYTRYIPNELKRCLMQTNRSPIEIEKLLERKLGDKYTLKNLIIRNYVNEIAAQHINKLSNVNQDFVLYEVLRDLLYKATDNLVDNNNWPNNSQIRFNPNKIETILYLHDDIQNEISNNDDYDISSLENPTEEIKKFGYYSNHLKQYLREALYDLVVCLEGLREIYVEVAAGKVYASVKMQENNQSSNESEMKEISIDYSKNLNKILRGKIVPEAEECINQANQLYEMYHLLFQTNDIQNFNLIPPTANIFFPRNLFYKDDKILIKNNKVNNDFKLKWQHFFYHVLKSLRERLCDEFKKIKEIPNIVITNCEFDITDNINLDFYNQNNPEKKYTISSNELIHGKHIIHPQHIIILINYDRESEKECESCTFFNMKEGLRKLTDLITNIIKTDA